MKKLRTGREVHNINPPPLPPPKTKHSRYRPGSGNMNWRSCEDRTEIGRKRKKKKGERDDAAAAAAKYCPPFPSCIFPLPPPKPSLHVPITTKKKRKVSKHRRSRPSSSSSTGLIEAHGPHSWPRWIEPARPIKL